MELIHLIHFQCLKAHRGSGHVLDLATITAPEQAQNAMIAWRVKLQTRGLPVAFFIEEKIKDAMFESLADYKFFCFHGVPKLFLCRFNGNRHFYDLDYAPIKLEGSQTPMSRIDLAPMIEYAKTLSAPFPFVRIDLYNGADGIYFGEYTFHVNAGKKEFDTATERRLGAYWT